MQALDLWYGMPILLRHFLSGHFCLVFKIVHAYLYLCVIFCAVLVSFLLICIMCVGFFLWLADLNWTRRSTEIMEWFDFWFSTFQVFILSDLKIFEISTLKWIIMKVYMVALTSAKTVFIFFKFIFVCCLLFFYFEWRGHYCGHWWPIISSFRITNLPWKLYKDD